MKKLLLLILILTAFKLSVRAGDLDSLKQTLQTTTNDTVKADLYLKMAKAYLALKAPSYVYRERNGENAVNCTMLALHLYSKMNDTTGIRNSYSSLSKAYRSQKQYTQAKWFMVQTSVMAKNQNDIPAMIAALVELADIKMETGDYILAKKDLSYALRLTSKYNVPDYQIIVIQNLAIADNGIKNLPEDQDLKDAKDLTAGYSTIVTESSVNTTNTDTVAVKAPVRLAKAKPRKTAKVAMVSKKNIKVIAADNLAAL